MKPSIADPAEPESTIHPPLACDALGNLLAIPEGTAAWRICRHTAGRRRALTGPDGAAMRFPLSTTAAELVELCGPDTYRVYALDEVGEVLDFVTTLQAARPRNANVPDVASASALRTAPLAASTTDLRFALHAIAEIARINVRRCAVARSRRRGTIAFVQWALVERKLEMSVRRDQRFGTWFYRKTVEPKPVRCLSPKMINNVLTVLRRMLVVARKRGLIESIPDVEWLKKEKPSSTSSRSTRRSGWPPPRRVSGAR